MTKQGQSYAELLNLAVHEFRTPVTVLSGYLRMLSRQQVGPLSERQQKLIEEAERSCARLTALVGEMSELANLDAGEVRLADHDVPLRELLEQALASLDEGRDRGVTAALDARVDVADVRGDRTRLAAALTALLRAVLRETTAAGEVPVTLDVRGEDGHRMASIVIGREGGEGLFDSPEAVLNEFRGGLGLALPIARRIITQHGGRVWSSNHGRLLGSVAVLLPVRENRS
jgi:signal transduction histidine kinase